MTKLSKIIFIERIRYSLEKNKGHSIKQLITLYILDANDEVVIKFIVK